eukprot:Rmarinus@m.20790
MAYYGLYLFFVFILGMPNESANVCLSGCDENAICETECQCNSGFYGTGVDCLPCGDHMDSNSGSRDQTDCFCMNGFEPTPSGICEEVCTMEEAMSFTISSLDTGVLSSGGCDLADAGNSRECCEVLASITSHKCMGVVLDVGRDLEEHPYFPLVESYREVCGLDDDTPYTHREGMRPKHVVVLEKKIRGNCGDGSREGWERCDDGNKVAGDGCSDCWVDQDYTCGDNDIGTSLCYVCAEACHSVHREMCLEPGGQCGACLYGYDVVGAEGTCGTVLQVYYVAVDDPYATRVWESDCEYEFLGMVAEPNMRFPDPVLYTSYLESIRPNRNVPLPGTCSLAAAASHAPRGNTSVVLVEVLHKEVVASNITVGFAGETFLVVFSNLEKYSTLLGGKQRLFDVYSASVLVVSGVIISDAVSSEGAAVRNFGGRVVFEDVIVQNCESPISSSDMNCKGRVIESAGAFFLRNTVFRNNTIEKIQNHELCFSYDDNVIMMYNDVQMENVLFEDNDVAGTLLSVYGDFTAHLSNITMVRNAVHSSSLFLLEMDAFLVNFTASQNSGMLGTVLSVRGRKQVLVSGFVVEDNIATDFSGIVYNLGTLSLRNGYFADNLMKENSAVVFNRGNLEMEGVTLINNQGAALDTTGTVSVNRCVFESNAGSLSYHSIQNTGKLVISDSMFDSPAEANVVNIKTTSSFVVRNSFLPNSESMRVAKCDDPLSWQYYPAVYPCGVLARCAYKVDEGVTCECPPGYTGDPTVLCIGPITLHVLPTDIIAVYPTKPPVFGNFTSTTEVRFVADGFGTLEWNVNNATVPRWLSLHPASGRFDLEGYCSGNPIDVRLTIDIEHVKKIDRSQIACIRIVTVSNSTTSVARVNSTDSLSSSEEDLPLCIILEAEVLPSAVTSTASLMSSCRLPRLSVSDPCEVEAESEVLLVVHLRDSAGYGLGVGGDTFTFVSSTVVEVTSEVDLGNGSYVLKFQAPQTHFSVSVELQSGEIQGSPLPFQVHCREGADWDDSQLACVSTTARIPRKIIAVVLLGVFLLAIIGMRLLKNRSEARNRIHSILEVDFADREAFFTLLGCFLDVLDVATDLGAYHSVHTRESLQRFEIWYLMAITLAVPMFFISMCTRLVSLRRILREFHAYAIHNKMPTSRLSKAIPVSGVYGFPKLVSEEDVRIVSKLLSRQLIGQTLAVVSLIVEDIPMQILNTFILLAEEKTVALIVSLQVTCFLVGIRISKVLQAWRTSKQLERLRIKAKQIRQMSK